jgi:3-oxoacyl-[acyl-carrier-protein] synthase III
MGPSIAILGTGSYAPAKIVSNHDLSRLVDTSAEWISTRLRRIPSSTDSMTSR